MKNLIIYFSWSNNTKKLVEEINKELNFDVFKTKIVPLMGYYFF